jgi:transglutaminase-like putative cysteine protease
VTRVLALAAATAALVIARASLRVAPGHAIRWASTGGTIAPRWLSTIDPLARAVASIGARMHASCLEQALALVILLAAAGVSGRLVIGVSNPGSIFSAHAWVEYRGRIVLGAAQAVDFVPLPSAAPPPCRA